MKQTKIPFSAFGWIRRYSGLPYLAYPRKEWGLPSCDRGGSGGPSAVKFNVAQPTALSDGHHWWLSALKVRSESSVAN
jgi:hypothetical protein